MPAAFDFSKCRNSVPVAAFKSNPRRSEARHKRASESASLRQEWNLPPSASFPKTPCDRQDFQIRSYRNYLPLKMNVQH